MAIDTANKRVSAISVSSPWRNSLPFPDGSVNMSDRHFLAYLFNINDGGAGAPPEVTAGSFRPIFRPRRR